MTKYILTKDKVPYYPTPQTDFKNGKIMDKTSNPVVTAIDEESVGGSTKPPYKGEKTKFYLIKGNTAQGWIEEKYLKKLGGGSSSLDKDKNALEESYKKIANKVNTVFDHIKELGIPGLDSMTVEDLVTSVLGEEGEGRLDVSTRLFGQPFQFTAETDLRITAKGEQYELGRKYTETFLGEAPICNILPGVASFLPNFSEEERDSLIGALTDSGVKGDNKRYLEEMLSEEARYFDFVSSYAVYMKYVNLMCRASAIYMGLGEVRVPLANIVNDKLQYFDWKNYKYAGLMVAEEKSSANYSVFDALEDFKDNLTKENLIKEATDILSGVRNYVEFYVDPATSFQETGTNQTTQSQLAGLMDSAQGKSKEFHFYKGLLDGSVVDSLVSNSVGAVGGAIGGFAGTVADALSGGLMSKLFGAADTVISGGNVILPEIWGDAAYQKSYSININLKSPYGDKESVYLHVLVPLFHLLALAAPRQITANGFAQPFLVKISAKGWYSCEMGMVDSISIEKVQGSYTVNGIPTEINVSLSVRDLYGDLMITPSTKPGLFISNRGLMNWLAVTSGVDITQPAFTEKWEGILKMLLVSKLDGVSDAFSVFKEKLTNIMGGINHF